MLLSVMLKAVSANMAAIHRHPFNQGLAKGTLPQRVFQLFLEQDELYLASFNASIRQVAIRLPKPEHSRQFGFFSNEVRVAERDLHTQFLAKYLGSGQPRLSHHMMPVVQGYTEHLQRSANQSPIEEAIASLLPCYLIYRELGDAMLKQPGYNERNPYFTWIRTYTSDEFKVSTARMVDIFDQLTGDISTPRVRQEIFQAFETSVKYELAFFETVYQQADLNHEPAESPVIRIR